jgi:phage terminase Nu1 subunit (DNA packaging protein)
MASRAEQYRDLARECFKLAEMVPAGEARRTLLDMAREWQRLADEQARATDLRKKE